MRLTRSGEELIAVTGRSLTGSSVVGRVEIDLTTGEVTYHGNLIGAEPFDPAWYAPICEALA